MSENEFIPQDAQEFTPKHARTTEFSANELDQQALNALFPEDNEGRLKKFLVAAGAGVLAVGTAAGVVLAQRQGIDMNDVLDTQFVPEPRVYPEIVDGFVVANEGLRTAAPFVAGAGILAHMSWYIAGKRNEHAQAVNRLAQLDYSDTEGALGKDGKTGFAERARIRAAAMGVGAIAVVAAALTGGMSGVEREISDGSLRPVEQTFDMLSAPNDENRFIILQSENVSFMDSSWLDRSQTNELTAQAGFNGLQMVPFGKDFPNIDGRSGLMITVPDQLYEQKFNAESGAEYCGEMTAVIDEANYKQVGQMVDLNGEQLEITEKITGSAQMNRDVAIVGEDAAARCLKDQEAEDTSYYGVVVSGAENMEEVEDQLEAAGMADEAVVITEEKFEDNNRNFWRKNGTPIILQTIGYIGALSAISLLALRRGKLLANASKIAVLRGQRVSEKDLRSAEVRRAAKQSAVSTAIATPFMTGLAAAFNAAEVGLKVGVGLREIMVGYTVTTLANVIGGRRAAKYIEKNLRVAEAVKKG